MRETLKRFKEKFIVKDGCWIWTAYCRPDGYPQFYYNGRSTYAHRASWEIYKLKDIPEDKFIVRTCGNRKCVYYRHLKLCSIEQHRASRSIAKDAKTKFKGVSFDRGLWKVVIQKDKKAYFIGRFKDQITAALAYNKIAKKYFGKFARLNLV